MTFKLMVVTIVKVHHFHQHKGIENGRPYTQISANKSLRSEDKSRPRLTTTNVQYYHTSQTY